MLLQCQDLSVFTHALSDTLLDKLTVNLESIMVGALSRSWHVILLTAIALLLPACGSSEDLSKSVANVESSGAVTGSVFGQQGPVNGAVVIVKGSDGREVGKATTNAQGEYRVSTDQRGPFMGEAKDSSGKAWYGISQNANMNITHLGDFLIRLWYQAKGLDVSTVFSGLSASSPMPIEQELTVAANQILSVPANALGKESVDLFGNQIGSTLLKILKGTTLESKETINIRLPEVNFSGSYNIKSRLSEQGEVIYEGSEETQSANVPLTKGSIQASVDSVQPSSLDRRQLKTSATNSNEHWMKDHWEFIKEKKLSEIVIPGTHDSGTYQIYGLVIADTPIAKNTAKTQTNSIGTQLKDGIRYFDLRVREARHWDCADPSVWWINHGDDWYSYRLQTALDEVKAFLAKPGNENEVVILDFQATSIRYEDGRARDVLLATIQDKLKGYLANNDGKSDWQKSSISDLVRNNKRAVVLLENFLYKNISDPKYRPGCGVKGVDYKNFSNRTVDQISHYEEYSGVEDIKAHIVDAQLNSAAAFSSSIPRDRELFEQYAKATRDGRLRILQLVPRPSNLWYAVSGALAVMPIVGSGYPNDLLSYATLAINSLLNYKVPNTPISVVGQAIFLSFSGDYKDYLASYGCQTGWLGKRLRLGIEGNPAKWNAPNIIIADNYAPERAHSGSEYAWVLPDYKNGQWVREKATSYVDMIISLNRIPREAKRLMEVVDLQDNVCLK